MDKSVKIFIVCALGAGIGSMVALEMHQYYWWVGVLTGGLTGYLAYDFKQVVEAIPKAYETVIGWFPCKKSWETILKTAWWSSCALATFLCVSLPVLMSAGQTNGQTGIIELFKIILLISSTSFPVLSALMFMFAMADKKQLPTDKDLAKLRLFNPISFFFSVVPKVIWFCIKGFPAAPRFLFETEHLQHSK